MTTTRSRDLAPLGALIVACMAFTIFFYPKISLQPGSHLFTEGGDGIKNYFTFAWHVQHDHSPLHFGGTNHPFGDHVFFADAHPWLAILLSVFSPPAGSEIALLNVLLLAGILLLPALCTYGVFRHYGLSSWIAVLSAFCITLMQPQLSRIGGHLSLAHAWVIPMGWLLVLRYLRSRSLRSALLLIALGSIAYLTHPYLGLMLTAFIGLIFLFDQLRHIRSIVPADVVLRGSIVVLPVLLFWSLMNAGDVIADRPARPSRPDEYHTIWSSFIHPWHEMFGRDPLGLVEIPEWESQVYLGLGILAAALCILLIGVHRAMTRQWGAQRSDLALPLASSATLLIFSSGMLMDLIGADGIFSQFRATGRFAWPFWYTLTTAVIVQAYHFTFTSSDRRLRTLYMFLLLMIAVEGVFQHVHIARFAGYFPSHFTSYGSDEEWKELTAVIQNTKAEGIIPLPLPNVGTEYYDREGKPHIMRRMFNLAYRSGTPLMACLTSRVSHSQARDLLALIAPPGHPKHLKDHFPSDAKFIVLWSGEQLDQDEQELFDRARPLMKNQIGEVRSIDHTELFRPLSDTIIPADLPEKHIAGVRIHAEDPGQVLVGNSGETLVSEYFFLLERPSHSLEQRPYELSFHYDLIDREAIRCWLVLESSVDGHADARWDAAVPIMSAPMQYEDKLIMRYRFQAADTTRWLRAVLIGPEGSRARSAISKVLLRPAEMDVWQTNDDEGMIYRNNIPIPASADR